MSQYKHVRLGLGTIATLLIILVVVAMIGTYSVKYYQSNFRFFKEDVATSFAGITTKNLESLTVEAQIFHPSTQQFNFTFVNAGSTVINITNIKINSPTLTVTAIPSASISTTAQTSVISSNSKSITFKIPGSLIFPGKTYTSAIPYDCLNDPVSVTITTSRGLVIKTQVAPNVGWYDSHWQFRKRITVDYTKVVGNLQYFPFLINTADTDLKNNALASGSDILFTSCNGVTKLNYEIENYTSLTGSVIAWAQVPKLNSTTGNIIYMYYGNNAPGNQQNIAATWDSNYGGVWHFKERASTASSIQKDNIKSTSATGSTITLSTFAIASNANRLLLVAVESSNGTVAANGITFQGQTFTKSISKSNTVNSEIWYLVNPPTGSSDIIVTMSASTNVVVGAYSLYGVDQTTPISASASKSGSDDGSGTESMNINTVNSNSLVINSLAYNNVAALTPNSPQILGWQATQGSSPNLVSSGSSRLNNTMPSTVTMGWTFSPPQNNWPYADTSVEIKPTPNAVLDSTSNQNHLPFFNLVYSDQVPGQMDGSLNFDGSTKYLARTSSLTAMPANNAAQTGSFWFWSSSTGTQDIYSLENSGSSSYLQTGFLSSNLAAWKGSGTGTPLISTSAPPASIWHYFVYTYNATAPITNTLYIDGVQITPTSTSTNIAAPSSLYVAKYSGGQFFSGKIDELRISTITRSANWITTEYNNQASPSTFYTVGPIENYFDMRSSK